MAENKLEMHDPLDFDSMRSRVYGGVLEGLSTKYPLENEKYRLELNNVRYDGPETYSLKDQKEAILKRQSLYRPIKGQWNLVNKADNSVVDKRSGVIARVPVLTQRGTYIMNGSEYTIGSQSRLRSGVYARRKESGELESHFNILSGGPGFRVMMEPKTGEFKFNVGQSSLKLYPLMKALGATDAEMREHWGDHFNTNVNEDVKGITVAKLRAKLWGSRARKSTGDMTEPELKDVVANMKLDPDVTRRTLGVPHDHIDKDVLLRATRKLININNGKEDTDDRDNLAYQETMSPDDLFKERIAKDSGRIASRALWKATLKGNLDGFNTNLITPQLESVIFKSGLGQTLEEINLLDALDQNVKITRLGEGGIGMDSIPDDSRSVQPSHMTYIDPVRTPESSSIGVDLRLTQDTLKGNDRQLYSKVINTKTGKAEYVPPAILTEAVVAFPGELAKAKKEGRRYVRALNKGQMEFVPAASVNFEAPNSQGMFTYGSNLVPMVGSSKAGRLLMAAKMTSQALPLQQPEAPLVSSMSDDGGDFYHKMGDKVGAVRSTADGTVVSVDKDSIVVRGADGKMKSHELYNMMPLNRKTFINNTPTVTPGTVVKNGQLLATSNMTDNNGSLAIGKNLKVGYMPYRGNNYEDAICISESAAKALSSEHMFTKKLDDDTHREVDYTKFISIFPSTYTHKQLSVIDRKTGVVKPGTVLNPDDPIILASERRTPKGSGMLYRGGKDSFHDASVTWDKPYQGVVTDVWSDDGVKVAVRAYAPAEVADKLSGRYGNKGVIGSITPDDKMPRGEDGKPLDVLLNPLGVISRGNSAQVWEALLGKVAAKRGKPYVMPAFYDGDMADMVANELQQHGVNDTETIHDPETGRNLPGILTGNSYIMKLHHTASGKESGRALGAYTAEGTPSRSMDEDDNPKRVGTGEMGALLSHGATEVIKDVKNIRGQRNDEYWRAMSLGYTPASPDMPPAYRKFMALLRSAGINVKKKGEHIHLTAMTDKDVDSISSGEITKPETVKWLSSFGRGVFGEKSMEPIEGGLFDRGITGAHGGCFHGSTRVITDVGDLAIKDIVENKLNVSVLSYDWIKRSFVYSKVTNWFANPVAGDIGSAVFNVPTYLGCNGFNEKGVSVLWGTYTHQVYTVDGSKRDLDAADYLLSSVETLTPDQEQILLGSLLGDGSISSNGVYSETHCVKQTDYVAWKCAMLRNFFNGGLERRKHSHVYKGVEKRYLVPSIRSKTSPIFRQWRNAFYTEGGVKRVPRYLVDRLTALGLAVWYMDDGSVCRRGKKRTHYITLCTHGFNLADVTYLQTLLRNRWNICSSLSRASKYGDRDVGWAIYLSGGNAARFLDVVAPYIHPAMAYKLGSRPDINKCKCGADVWRGREICNNCLVAQAKTRGTHKLGKDMRRRLGPAAVIRQMVSGAVAIPCEVVGTEAYDARQLKLGSALSTVVCPTAQPRQLIKVPVKFFKNQGKKYEQIRTAYDIEVDCTHNYFANGMLVSNSKWSHYTLSEPLPAPAMEDPIRRLLGLTVKDYENTIAGRHELQGLGTGTQAIKAALSRIRVPEAIERERSAISSATSASAKDASIKRLGYLMGLQKNDTKPEDLIITKVPILPPIFRPISANNKFNMVAGANLLYMDLINADKNLAELKGQVEGDVLNEAKLTVYKALKGVTGLGDPIKPERIQQRVHGVLGEIFGSSPKMSTFQHKLLGTSVDLAARAAITPNPELDMDQIGLPEDQAWKLYGPFVVRRLIKTMGNQPDAKAAAVRMVSNRDKMALDALNKEMEDRPVLASRAPALHRYSMMAFKPVLTKGRSLQTSPAVIASFGGDYDGDQIFGKVLCCLSREAAVYCTQQLKMKLQRSEVMYSKKLRLPACKDGKVYVFDLEDFPHGDLLSTKEGKNGRIDFHTAITGTSVLSYDEKENKLVWATVAGWSRHYQREIEIVELVDGRQIITDDDPRAVYGVEAGTLKLVRNTPTIALAKKMLVPAARHIELETTITSYKHGCSSTGNQAIPIKPDIALDSDFGYLVGVMAGDGWVVHVRDEAKGIYIAGVTDEIQNKVEACVGALFVDKKAARCNYTSTASYGPSKTSRYTSVLLGRVFEDLIGCGARNKHLPTFYLSAPREFREGLFAGLMDTDGTISISNGKAKPQLMVAFSSTSLRLIEEVRLLAASLGMYSRISATSTPAGLTVWQLTISAPDVQRWGGKHMAHSVKLSKLRSVPTIDTSATSLSRTNLVPISESLAVFLRKKLGTKDIRAESVTKSDRAHMNMYTSLSCAGSTNGCRGYGYISRNTAKTVVAAVSREVILEHADGATWLRIVADESVSWARVKAVEKTGIREDGYDLTVPGYETFMSVDGVILSNTMNFHVVVSDKAVAEAKEKMLPSRNLRSPADFGTMWAPRQEFLQGLYTASTVRSGRRMLPKFNSVKDVVAAFHRGELDLQDVVSTK